MLEYLGFQDVGPAPKLELTFRERLNFLAGDNGLGKTFFLDAAWWALTRTWAHQPLRPTPPPSEPVIKFRYGSKSTGPVEHESRFDHKDGAWGQKAGRPPIPGLVLYAQVDGGFSVWDPARNYWKGKHAKRPSAFAFSAGEVWDGLPLDQATKLCNGLIADWQTWQLEDGEAFGQLRAVLSTLSPSDAEALEPGELVKITPEDARRYPTIKTAYGQEVPLVHASAGIRRIVALAYLLVWAWQEHVASAQLRGEEATQEIIFLVDEIEAHLHPQWQRRIVPALLRVVEALTGSRNVRVQLVVATHSPLVLASAETLFEEERDAVWELDLKDGRVQLSEYPWVRLGDANAWLTSSVFDLAEPRSLEAERAITQALALLRQESPEEAEMEVATEALSRSLSDIDRFWVRWSQFRESGGSKR